MPPPVWPNVTGPLVKKSRFSALTPRNKTEPDDQREHADREEGRERRQPFRERG